MRKPLSAQLDDAREQARSCTRCDLYKNATQTVFGEGPARARLMLVGEQPGDREDLAGHPFVGPAGGVLDRALHDLGIDRDDVYVTNVVKHFRWERSGKRRIHKTPGAEHVRACLPWFNIEFAAVQPAVVVCLGAVAAKALLGQKFRLTVARGVFVDWDRPSAVLATVHPAAVVRSDDREAAYRGFLSDLAVAADYIKHEASARKEESARNEESASKEGSLQCHNEHGATSESGNTNTSKRASKSAVKTKTLPRRSRRAR